MTNPSRQLPIARADGLIVNELGEDVLVYDQASHTIHQLNLASASVWKLCDGRTSLDTVALNTGLTPDNVRAALAKLDDAGLFEESLAPELRTGTRSRRSFMRKAAIAGTIPIVTSISAPMAARASSTSQVQCGLPNNFCATGQSCCHSTLCCDNGSQECWSDTSPFCRTRCGDNRLACGASSTNPGRCCLSDERCSDSQCVTGRPGGSN